MSVELLPYTQKIANYLFENSVRDLDILKKLREKTQSVVGASMQISPQQGQLMQVLLQSIQAKRVLEIGTFTGYSALVMALALPEDGYILTCDRNEEMASIAQAYWQEAGVNEKIELRLGNAIVSLDNLIQSHSQAFDFVFIDADKNNYQNYYERALQLIRQGGMIAIDNVLWDGKVTESLETFDKQTASIHALNQFIHQDQRVNASIIPIGDGLTIAVKK
ncbi:MAG: SAM-dependent methyltransferase [Legionellales bacterium]|mgnify:CR=1 FL=1|nr:SAM-dependent methyltransferase [Legionellales bacterium]|tara:strand:- start:233 stop:895 length:663 start_codon:yes stop_codon:yes gene_type:complete